MKKPGLKSRLLALFLISSALSPANAVTIEGQTPAGTYKQVQVTAAGLLQVNALSTPGTCTKNTFTTINIGSTTATTLIAMNASASQSLFYVEGPADLGVSSQTATFSGSPAYTNRIGSPWARYTVGAYFSLDTPASNTALLNGLALPVGSSTYTVVSVSQCGN